MSRFTAVLLLTAPVWGCGDLASPSGAGDGPFALPMGGNINDDWYLTNYLDAASTSTVDDYQCGPRSYPGHRGTDMVLPDFASMDLGLDVLAAADGTVIDTHDGEFDRHKSWEPGVTWNVVTIDHGDGYIVHYGHLKNGSLEVAVGDRVVSGQKLAEVGSSGRSDMPHLHMEVRRDGEVVDPWDGPCGGPSSLWRTQIPYQDQFRVIQSGVTTDTMSLDRVKDPPRVAAFVTSGTGTISAWVQYHNQEDGAVTRWRWLQPDGTVYTEFQYTHSTFYPMSWWWNTLSRSGMGPAGTWTVQIITRGDTASMTFSLATPGLDGPAHEVRGVIGGGGIR